MANEVDAYGRAQDLIEQAIEAKQDMLELGAAGTQLATIPHEIIKAVNLRTIDLSNTQVTDLFPITMMHWIDRLDIDHTPVSDLSQLSEMTELEVLNCDFTKISDIRSLEKLKNLKWLYLEGTDVSDLSGLPTEAHFGAIDLKDTKVSNLRPLLKLIRRDEIGELTFRVTNTPAARADPRIAEIDAMEDHPARVKALLDYIATLPPIDDAPAKNNADPITVTAVLEAQDQTGWRFSPTHGALELFILSNGDTAQQQKMAELVKQRLDDLLSKLRFGNSIAIRQDTLTEAERFSDLLNDDASTYSENALALWTSLIALGGHLEANDAGQLAGRDQLDLLKPDDRGALQTFLAIASGFVRSFEDTKSLDDSVTAFGRTALPLELLSDVLGKAVEQALINAGSASLITDVAKLAAQETTQGDKAHAVTATGSKNLVMTAALVSSIATGSGLVAGATGKVGSDIVDHYELSKKAIGFLDSIGGELESLIRGLSPDESANLVSVLKDFKDRRLAK